MEFRAAPFWAWNSAVEPEECRRQIRLMKQAGLGGFFMHSRIGLETEYLGREFMECVGACVDEAKKLGMKAYLYDEDRWPSGAAGGLVTRDPRFRTRELHILRGTDAVLPEDAVLLGIYLARFEGETMAECRRVDDGERAGENCELLRCYSVIMAPSPWYNGQTYLDTMNPEAVKAFLDTTHERYVAMFGAEFGKTIPGIFSDEPSYVNFFNPEAMPWTDAIPQKFQERYHYDLQDHLPELFYETAESFSQARHDFYELATTLFTESFVKQIGDWCERHHVVMTGHILNEDSLQWQVRACGSAMRSYPYMGMPGIDLIGEYWLVFNTVKQLVSVAHQLGKTRRLTETYGCTGWDFPLLGHKALGDWQYALGVNFRCQHLAWYSMKGETKRDYPASISFQSPWFAHYSHIEDYFARLGAAMVPGEEVRDILVVHPAEAAWGVHTQLGKNREIERLDMDFLHLTYRLLDAHLDFDFGDEQLMAEFGSVKDGLLAVGRGRYKAVVVPDVPYLAPTTVAMLERFQAADGTVLRLGTQPMQFSATTLEQLSEQLEPCRRVSLKAQGTEAHGVLYRLSHSDDGTVLFLCNTAMDYLDNFLESARVWERRKAYPEVELTLTMPQEGELLELHPEDGSVSRVRYDYRDGAYHCRFALDALASKLFFVGPGPEGVVREAVERAGETAEVPARLTGYQLSEGNALILDHPAYAIDGGKWQKPQFILDLDCELRKRLGVPVHGSQMVQPWCAPKMDGKLLELALEYRFAVDVVPRTPCYIVVEEPGNFDFELNGRMLPAAKLEDGFWVDPSMRRLRIPAEILRMGENVLRLRCRYHAGLAGLESLYLLGAFGVEDDHVVELPKTLTFGDWCRQRLPYYSGNLNYELHFTPKPERRYAVEIGDWRGSEVEVFVNGQSIRCLTAFKGKIELENLLPGQDNRLDITVYGHRRNSMGPFWATGKSLLWIGFQVFRKHEVEERQLVPCGLLEEPKVLSRPC